MFDFDNNKIINIDVVDFFEKKRVSKLSYSDCY